MNPEKIGVFIPEYIDQSYGSVRIRGLNVLKALTDNGYKTAIIQNLDNLEKFSHIIVPQVVFTLENKNNSPSISKINKNSYVKFILDICEFFLDKERISILSSGFEKFNLFITASYPMSKYLQKKFCDSNIIYIPDIVEVEFKKIGHKQKDKLNIFWYGFKENFESINQVLSMISSDKDINLITMSNSENADYLWDMNKWEEIMINTDIGISPVIKNLNFVSIIELKSSHKITSFMAKGIPVIASPIGEYKNVISSGIDGYIADLNNEWKESIESLKNIDTRKKIGETAFITAQKYSSKKIFRLWDFVLKNEYDKAIDLLNFEYINDYESYDKPKLKL